MSKRRRVPERLSEATDGGSSDGSGRGEGSLTNASSRPEGLAPISEKDLDRPVSARLFIWAVSGIVTLELAAGGYAWSRGQAKLEQLDDLKPGMDDANRKLDAITLKINDTNVQKIKKSLRTLALAG